MNYYWRFLKPINALLEATNTFNKKSCCFCYLAFYSVNCYINQIYANISQISRKCNFFSSKIRYYWRRKTCDYHVWRFWVNQIINFSTFVSIRGPICLKVWKGRFWSFIDVTCYILIIKCRPLIFEFNIARKISIILWVNHITDIISSPVSIDSWWHPK